MTDKKTVRLFIEHAISALDAAREKLDLSKNPNDNDCFESAAWCEEAERRVFVAVRALNEYHKGGEEEP